MNSPTPEKIKELRAMIAGINEAAREIPVNASDANFSIRSTAMLSQFAASALEYTLTLFERIDALEARVKELEDTSGLASA